MRTWILAGLVAALSGSTAFAAADEGRAIPEPLAPFEHMIGSWKGQGIPTANRIKGWSEKHMWAWKFAGGIPVAMSVVLEGNKTLAKAELTVGADGKQYRLQGIDPEGKPVTFAGTYGGTARSKMLTLDRVGETSAGKERLVIWPNSNMIRYIFALDRQEPGAPQFKRAIEVGLTKEGEQFAAGGSAADRPKCIITGGAAAMTVSYQGKTYDICCTGCRDEFNDNPEKYVKKAALRAEQGASKSSARAASAAVGKDDGAFSGFGEEGAPRGKPAAPRVGSVPAPAGPAEPAKAEDAPGTEKDEAKAASLLRLGQNLEKSGKSAASLPYYQRIVKEYPATTSARTAAERIKALGGK
jgi:YHS domain-containing protein